jgi:hypothetical protein
MREFNALDGYPQPKEPRVVKPERQTIQHRIIASYRGEEFFDGDRSFGYGGLRYDGRWLPIAKNMLREYSLHSAASILHIGCEKAFLLHDFLQVEPSLKVRGLDPSEYAIEHAMPDVRPFVRVGSYTALPFADREFDLVLAIGPVYTLNLGDAIKCLREIERVGKGKSFITLGSYETEQDLRLFKAWSVLGTTILRPDEWRAVLQEAGYSGDYAFVSARTLN